MMFTILVVGKVLYQLGIKQMLYPSTLSPPFGVERLKTSNL